jgi:hypothetical protein
MDAASFDGDASLLVMTTRKTALPLRFEAAAAILSRLGIHKRV